MSEALVDRVRKLLVKAESTTNAHEAEAFSAKAAELIAAHRLDPSRVRESLQRGSLTVNKVMVGRGAYVRARLALLVAVARHHDCEVVFQSSPQGTIALVAGFDVDLEVTDVLYTSLHQQAASQMAGIRQRTPAATQRFRRSFLFGYARRVGELLAESRQNASEAAAPKGAVAPTTLPDVLERTSRVREFAASSFGRVVSASPARPAEASGWRAGHRAAGRADLGRRRVAGQRELGSGG